VIDRTRRRPRATTRSSWPGWLIRRLPDPSDRRGTLIEPTETGHAIWEGAVGTQAAREAKFASVLDAKGREDLHRLLRILMRAFPGSSHHAPPERADAAAD
jgi:hypothetical protein